MEELGWKLAGKPAGSSFLAGTRDIASQNAGKAEWSMLSATTATAQVDLIVKFK